MNLTGDPGLGLALGLDAPNTMLQILGHLLLAQRTLRGASDALRRYSSLFAEGFMWGLVEHGDRAVLSCEPQFRVADFTRCSVDYSMAMAIRIGRHFVPRGRPPFEVRFQHREPSYAARYPKAFGCPVSFGQPTNGLEFPRAYLDLPQAHPDETLRSMLDYTADRLVAERRQSLSTAERVRIILRYHDDLREVSHAVVARWMGLTVRTLRRKLSREQTPLTSLLDEARCRSACASLREPDASLKETAFRMGYSDSTAFNRAFKRWTGTTPGAYARAVQPRYLLSEV